MSNSLSPLPVPIDNIKNEFYLYKFIINNKQHGLAKETSKMLPSKYNYTLKEQEKYLDRNKVSINGILEQINKLAKSNLIPVRYKYTAKTIEFPDVYEINFTRRSNFRRVVQFYTDKKKFQRSIKKNKGELIFQKFTYHIKLKIFTFNIAIISLLEQKDFEDTKNIVNFFKDYTETQGITFDEYVDKMVTNCITKYWKVN